MANVCLYPEVQDVMQLVGAETSVPPVLPHGADRVGATRRFLP